VAARPIANPRSRVAVDSAERDVPARAARSRSGDPAILRSCDPAIHLERAMDGDRPEFPESSSRVGARPSALPNPREPRRRVGVFDPRRVRTFSFAMISLSIFGAGTLCILSVWNYVRHDVGWRAIATLGIVVATMVAFMLVNEFFGASLAMGGSGASGAGGSR
jgi:hypothetical protein